MTSYEVVIFSGAYGTVADYCNVVNTVSSTLPGASIHVLAVQDVLGCNFWAPYTPTADEVAHHVSRGWSEEDAFRRAETWTYHADLTQLERAINAIPPCTAGKRRLFIGFSNGAIVAAAAALRFGAHGLWLASGVVTDEQATHLRQAPCRIAVSAGWHECYWGGCGGVFYQLKDASFQVDFDGRHAQEPDDVTERIIRWLTSVS